MSKFYRTSFHLEAPCPRCNLLNHRVLPVDEPINLEGCTLNCGGCKELLILKEGKVHLFKDIFPEVTHYLEVK